MKRQFILTLVLLLALAVRAAEPQARQYVNLQMEAPETDSLVQALIAEAGQTVAMPCTYQSVDQHGLPVTVSGKIYFPKQGLAKRFVLEPHYTILANKECPSECDMIEAVLRDKGFALLMPDYVGYGITRDRNHPYLHCAVAAQNTVDLYLAAAAFLEKLNRTPENDSLVIVGYSQGAQSAVATLRLLETAYPEVPVKQCYAGSGPYDVARTYDVAVAKNNAGLSFTIPLLIMGTSWAYDLNLNPKDFMNLRTIRRSEKYVFSKEHTAGEVVLLGRLGWSLKVSKYMTKEGMDKTKPETARLYEGFKRSSIVHISETDTILGDWTPKTPLFILHSYQDTAVPFENSESLRYMLETRGVENVEYDFGNYGDHLSAMARFFDVVRKRL